jgi:hypothetical protein
VASFPALCLHIWRATPRSFQISKMTLYRACLPHIRASCEDLNIMSSSISSSACEPWHQTTRVSVPLRRNEETSDSLLKASPAQTGNLMTWPHDILGQPPWHADMLPHYLLTKPSSTSLADTLALAGCSIDDWVVCRTSALADCHTNVSGFRLVLVGISTALRRDVFLHARVECS